MPPPFFLQVKAGVVAGQEAGVAQVVPPVHDINGRGLRSQMMSDRSQVLRQAQMIIANGLVFSQVSPVGQLPEQRKDMPHGQATVFEFSPVPMPMPIVEMAPFGSTREAGFPRQYSNRLIPSA